MADVYDALTSERSYKPRFSHEYAKEVLRDGRGTQFDPTWWMLFWKGNMIFATFKTV